MAVKRLRKRRGKVDLVWTEHALRDLERIENYIAEDSPAAAARWVGKLSSTAATVDAREWHMRSDVNLGEAGHESRFLEEYGSFDLARPTVRPFDAWNFWNALQACSNLDPPQLGSSCAS
jgi:plasmid stabilization system protein ParE